jgi:hypothetical protein
MAALSFRIRQRARRRTVGYSFLFMRAGGDQLRKIVTHVEEGRAGAGKVVIRMP